MAEFKTYVLLDHMNPSNTSIYRRINKNQRQLMNKLPKYRPYMQVTFTDKDGNNKTIRYKSTTNEIHIKKALYIPKNQRSIIRCGISFQ